MLAILYMLLCAAFGIFFVSLSVPDVRRLYIACSPSAKSIAHIPNTLFTVPAGIVTGMMCVPFFNYYVTLGLSYLIDSGELCKKLGVLITFAFFLWMILTCLILINRRRIKREELKASGSMASIEDYNSNIVDSVFYGIVIVGITVAATFLMFYTYRVNGTTLLNGYSTFSDLSPHTAMVSSFGEGFNFPTQYMHFSGDGIKYHFLFYFLAGTLQYLGLPIDYALNIPSIASMVCALVLLGLLAVLISSRRTAFLVAPILVLFRSSLNVFYHFSELVKEGLTSSQALKEIMDFSSWYAVTDYDGWGIWAINVYPNQRHLMLGVAVILVMVIIFLPFVRRLGISVSRAEGFGGGIKAFVASKNAWLPRSGDPLYPVSIAIYACVLVIVMPYFHGSCLIALLLVLFGMAIFSESRLLYLATAVCAVVSSFIQTLVFSGGYKNVVSFAFEPGFILTDITFSSLVKYLFIVTGFTLILAVIFALTSLVLDIIRKKPVHRFLLFICALFPMIFAFLFKVSLEMLANHKFIQVSLILIDAFVAALIANLVYIPIKRRKADNTETSSSDEEDIIDAEAMDGDIAVAVSAETKGIRTPVLSVASAFGEPLEDEEEKEIPDIKAIDEHTGVDADVSSLGTAQPELKAAGDTKEDVKEETGSVEVKPAEEEKESGKEPAAEETAAADVSAGGDEASGVKGPENAENVETEGTKPEDTETKDGEVSEVEVKDSEIKDAEVQKTEVKEDEAGDADKEGSEEAKAGAAAIAALFGEAIENKTTAETETTVAEEPADDSDDSDIAVMEASPEPAHISVRPGSVALQSVSSGGDLPDDVADANAAIESAVEVVETTVSVDAEKDLKPESLKHEPIKSKKQKGLPFPAWIALEMAGVILAVALMVPLTATGVSEWATYVNLNSSSLTVNTNSPVTKWILENTDPSDAFLTPMWSMNRFLLSGRPMYYGWPYYAWSAGHDTYTRDTIYLWLISGCGGDIDEFTRYCKERHIKYLIADPDFDQTDYGNGITFNRRFFEENLTQAAYFAEENTTIYRIY